MEEQAKADVETAISTAIRKLLPDLKRKADSLTPEGVRRLLEKDLDMVPFALDAHKRFIRKQLNECLYAVDDGGQSDNQCKSQGKEKDDEQLPIATEMKNSDIYDEKAQKPSSELLGATSVSLELTEVKDQEKIEQSEGVLSEEIICDAVKKRAPYFTAHSETITLLGARRLIEDDLKLQKYALDAYKNVVRDALNEVLGSGAASSASAPITSPSRDVTEQSKNTADELQDISREDRSSELSDSGEILDACLDDTRHGRQKKSASSGGKGGKTGVARKRKRSGETKKQEEPTLSGKEDDSNDVKCLNEDDSMEASLANDKREKKSAIGAKRKIEQMKNIIKLCRMSIPPLVYKRVKQAPGSERDMCLIKELEEILQREGLSSNSSDKEINIIRKKKEREKELEGIDMANIITSSRSRRSASSFFERNPPIKDKINSDNEDSNGEGSESDDSSGTSEQGGGDETE